MKAALSTLSCPAWDLETVLDRASTYGFDGVDFRGLGEDLDVTRTARFTDDLDATRAAIAEAGLTTSAVSTSVHLCAPEEREENLAEARRTIPVADALDVDCVRVFGGGDLDARSREELADVAAETMGEILDLEGARDLTWAVETHDHWTRSADCRLLLDRIDDDAVGVLWDVGHTTRVSDESPAESLDVFGDDVAYLHLKDAVRDPDHPDAMDDGWRYVLPGEGALPLAEALTALEERGYDGWVNFEHEKRWHPELEPPEVANPAFVEWFESVTR
ncbi:MAG: sugar phosphate isomerase/epimerase family protein [Halobacteriaceae archaeon]